MFNELINNFSLGFGPLSTRVYINVYARMVLLRNIEISKSRYLEKPLGSQNNRGVSPKASPRFGVLRINAC